MELLQEKDLLDQTFADGGEAELSLAIEVYGQALLRYCHNIPCDYHEAQDTVQITFLKAYENRRKYRNGTSLSAWLYRIAYHTCIDTIRRKTLFFFTPAADSQKPHTGISDELFEALSRLSAMERSLIYGRVMEERSYCELAKIHQITESAARKRYERARKKLAGLLRKDNRQEESSIADWRSQHEI